MPREGCIGGVLIEAAAGGSSVEAKKPVPEERAKLGVAVEQVIDRLRSC